MAPEALGSASSQPAPLSTAPIAASGGSTAGAQLAPGSPASPLLGGATASLTGSPGLNLDTQLKQAAGNAGGMGVGTGV